VRTETEINKKSGWPAMSAAKSSIHQRRKSSRGGVIEGLSSVMNYEITIDAGRALQSNFHEYPPVRMNQLPAEIEVHFLRPTIPHWTRRTRLAPGSSSRLQRHLRRHRQPHRSLPLAKHGFSWA